MTLNIRLAREQDVQVLEQLFLEFSQWQIRRDEAIRKAIRDPAGELLVAESSGRVVAFIHQVFFQDPLHAGLNSAITGLFVSDRYRGRGIASQLVKRALENAKTRKVVEVHVDTEESNRDAVKLYERLGFRKVGVMFERNP